MNEMEAVVYTALNHFEVASVEVPTPGPGEVLVRVEAAGLCHTDLDILSGHYAAELPRIPGHEFAGTIVDVGDADLNYRLGQRVAIDPLIACGVCRNCSRGHANLCLDGSAYGAELDGGFAEYAVVLSDNAHDAGDLPAEVAALAEPFGCVVNAINRAGVPTSSRAAIIGAGPMGMMLSIGLRGRGYEDVTVADRLAERLERAGQFGATSTALIGGALADALPERGFDLVIDATGRPDVVQQATRLLADAGTLIPFGVCPPGSQLHIDPNEVYRRQLRIIGSFSLNRGIPEALRILATSDFPVGDLVTRRLPLAKGAEALASIGAGDTIKVQFAPGLGAHIQ